MRFFENKAAYVLIYIISAIIIYLILILRQKINNPILMASLLAILIPLFLYFISLSPKNIIKEGLSRYTMRCNSCNWEWMSNIAEKAPDICPRCRKDKLEIIGWRKVNIEEAKSDKTLYDFLK